MDAGPRSPTGKSIRRGTAIKSRALRRRKAAAMTYQPAIGVNGFVQQIRRATPLELMETERNGVSGQLLKDLARRMDIPLLKLYEMVGVPKATAEKKAASKALVSGAGGQAALGIAKLLAIAEDIVANSTAEEAKHFDAGQWLGRWIEKPQPALGNRRPAEMLDTPTGISMVSKVLGAIESGAYV